MFLAAAATIRFPPPQRPDLRQRSTRRFQFTSLPVSSSLSSTAPSNPGRLFFFFFPLSFRPDVSVTLSAPPPHSPLHDLTPSSQKLFEVSGSLTFLVSSKRRTRCNFLLILSSPCSPGESRRYLRTEAESGGAERAVRWGEIKCRERDRKLAPSLPPIRASLPLLPLSACSPDSHKKLFLPR